jgi:hypothetical protein
MHWTERDMNPTHGWRTGPPDSRGRVLFVLFWRRIWDGQRRAEEFRATPANHPLVVWHPSEIEARDAAWGEE